MVRRLYPFIARREAKVCRLYRYRHNGDTFATLLLMSNVPLTYISEQSGHKDPSVTVEHYARWLPGSNREAMDVLPGPDSELATETFTARQIEESE